MAHASDPRSVQRPSAACGGRAHALDAGGRAAHSERVVPGFRPRRRRSRVSAVPGVLATGTPPTGRGRASAERSLGAAGVRLAESEDQGAEAPSARRVRTAVGATHLPVGECCPHALGAVCRADRPSSVTRHASAARMAQSDRDPAGPAAEDARDTHPEIRGCHPRCIASLVGTHTGRGAAAAACVAVVVRPAHTPTCAPASWSITAWWAADWSMRPASGVRMTGVRVVRKESARELGDDTGSVLPVTDPVPGPSAN